MQFYYWIQILVISHSSHKSKRWQHISSHFSMQRFLVDNLILIDNMLFRGEGLLFIILFYRIKVLWLRIYGLGLRASTCSWSISVSINIKPSITHLKDLSSVRFLVLTARNCFFIFFLFNLIRLYYFSARCSTFFKKF